MYEKIIDEVVTKVARSWEDLTAEQQRDYLMRHKRSKRRFGPKSIPIPSWSKITPIQKRFQGGLSDDIAHSQSFKDYIGEGRSPGGYYGQTNRSPESDKIVESELRKHGLEGSGIAYWLTSASARHMMTDVPKNITKDNLKDVVKRVRLYTHNAFWDVLIWSHPDHGGSMGSSRRLMDLIKHNVEQPKEEK